MSLSFSPVRTFFQQVPGILSTAAQQGRVVSNDVYQTVNANAGDMASAAGLGLVPLVLWGSPTVTGSALSALSLAAAVPSLKTLYGKVVSDASHASNHVTTKIPDAVNAAVTNATTNINSAVTNAATNLDTAVTHATANLNTALSNATKNLNTALTSATGNLNDTINNGSSNLGNVSNGVLNRLNGMVSLAVIGTVGSLLALPVGFGIKNRLKINATNAGRLALEQKQLEKVTTIRNGVLMALGGVAGLHTFQQISRRGEQKASRAIK